MKLVIIVAYVASALGASGAHKITWRPSPRHRQVPIWARAAPDARPVPGPEYARTVKNDLIAGRAWTEVDNVSRPTMTVYSPRGKNTGVAVVVFPGGGFQILAIDLEGTEVCDWLTSNGITCVLLKYRVPGPPWDWRRKRYTFAKSTLALEDAQRTVGLMRFHAVEWHIDSHKIGALGFSAGGYLVAEISTNFEHRFYPYVDAADNESCRPDFAVALYPGHLVTPSGLNPNVPVTSRTPPTLLLQAEDDPEDSVNNSLVYYMALEKAGVPVEMHLYAHGGHAFGLRHTKFPVTGWPQLAETCLLYTSPSPRDPKTSRMPSSA